MTHAPAFRIVGLGNKVYPSPPQDAQTAKTVREAMPEVRVLYPDSALGVGDLSGAFSALL